MGGTTLPGGRVSRQSQGVKGWMKPDNIKNHYFEKHLLSLVLNLTVYVRNVIFLFYKQKPGEIPISKTFLAKNSILAYISL